jgi:hypothetical protein
MKQSRIVLGYLQIIAGKTVNLVLRIGNTFLLRSQKFNKARKKKRVFSNQHFALRFGVNKPSSLSISFWSGQNKTVLIVFTRARKYGE